MSVTTYRPCRHCREALAQLSEKRKKNRTAEFRYMVDIHEPIAELAAKGRPLPFAAIEWQASCHYLDETRDDCWHCRAGQQVKT